MVLKCTVLFSLLIISAYSDVSHLLKNAYSTYQSTLNTINGGYFYDPPLAPTLTTVPPTAPTPPFLPEIIVNKKTPLFTSEVTYNHPDIPRDVYLPPAPPSERPIIIPPLSDEFEPPAIYPAVEIPASSAYLPPVGSQQHDPPNAYLPSSVEPLLPQPPAMDEAFDGGYHYPTPHARGLKEINFSRAVKHTPLQLELNDLRCLNSFKGRNGYFKVNIVVQSFIENLPIVDTDIQDPRCRINLIRTKFVLNLSANDFHRCGVYSCSDHEFCLKIRFPQIDGMKSIGDAILTLQCKIQEKTTSKIHSLRFGVNNFNQARSAGTFAHGGNQQPFRTHLGLFRNVDGIFTKSLESGSVVQLGEELMLRAHVKSGDGWNHSRVTDVSLQRLSPTGEILNSATLIKSNGCINPAMRSICPFAPIFEAPLGYRVGFRAVMFQGMKSGDEMIITVKIVGCIDNIDCAVEHQHCSDDAVARIRRETNNQKDLVDVSRISFRVAMPSGHNDHNDHNNHSSELSLMNPIGGIVAVATICCICILGIIGFSIANRRFLLKLFGRFNDDLI